MKKKLLIKLGVISATILPVATVVSCEVKNPQPTDTQATPTTTTQPQKQVAQPKPNLTAAQQIVNTYSIKQLYLDHNKDGVENFAFVGHIPEPTNQSAKTYWNIYDMGEDMSPLETLPKVIYNGIVAIMDTSNKNATIADALGVSSIKSLIGENPIVTAVVTGDEFHVEFQKMTKDGATAESYLDSSDILEIEKVSTVPYGSWMARVKFFEKNNGNPDWEHGKSSRSNYNITGYPLYLVNMDFAQLGITSQKMYSGQIIHITYNHTA